MQNWLGRNALTLLIGVACTLSFFFLPRCTFSREFSLAGSLFYSFSHANIFHLSANLYALYLFKPRFSTCVAAYFSAVTASLLPFSCMAEPTCGLSAFVFAAYARKYCLWRLPLHRIFIINLVFAILPHFNWKIHLISFIVSYSYWYARSKVRASKSR